MKKTKKISSMGGKLLVNAIAAAAEDKKAEHMIAYQAADGTSMADWYFVCQGDNQVHSRAIAEGIVDALEELGVKPWHLEGSYPGSWVLVDYFDVVVHVMTPDARKNYAIDDLWKDTCEVVKY